MSLFPTSARRGLAAGGAVLLLGGSAVGIAAAQSTPSPSPASSAQTSQASPGYQRFVDALAKRLGISSAALQQAVGQARTDVGLPASGGFEVGHDGRGGFGKDLSAAAQAIGIPASQLQQELPGKSLAQVAQAHGKTAADVATALENAAHQRIDQAVMSGRLTADQATQRKQQVDQSVQQRVNDVVPQGGPVGPRAAGTPTA